MSLEVEIIKYNKYLIFAVVVFILSLNFAFAQDANTTQVTHQSNDVSDNIDSIENYDLSAEVVNPEDNIQIIKMGKVTKRYNGAVEYQATFYNIDGKPMKNTSVSFLLDNKLQYDVTTDSEGVAHLTILIGNGVHDIIAVSMDPPAYEHDTIKVFKVITGNKDFSMYYDGGTSYTVRVFDDNENPVKAGQKVTFAVGSKLYTKKTNSKGYAKLKITFAPGIYLVAVKYKDYVVTNYITVKPVLKSLTSFKNRISKPTIKYKIKFLGKNKKNKKIKVKFNKKIYYSKTDKKGIATFTLKTPKKVGSYKFVASYKKSKIEALYMKY